MSSVQLLDKTRKIGKLLHNNNSSKVVFNDICNVLKEILQSNVLVISKKGKILGVGRTDGIETLDELFESKVGVFVDSLLNERFLSVLSTKENVNLEMLRSVNEESAEEVRKRAVVKSALSTLSQSELEAIIHIFDELGGMEGILVASKIADRIGITRSVIVNALRKFESAGVIESRSSGMKGTYIKVVNDLVYEELDRVKKNM